VWVVQRLASMNLKIENVFLLDNSLSSTNHWQDINMSHPLCLLDCQLQVFVRSWRMARWHRPSSLSACHHYHLMSVDFLPLSGLNCHHHHLLLLFFNIVVFIIIFNNTFTTSSLSSSSSSSSSSSTALSLSSSLSSSSPSSLSPS